LELVSIVIPTYNRADLLPQAIQSALNQTYENTEIIIVDDGSTDDTPDLCRKYAGESRVRYIRKRNGGIGSALNTGISAMKGEWFKWLSSDDYLQPEAVELLLRKAHDVNGKIIYSSYRVVDAKNEVIDFCPEYQRSYLDFVAHLVRAHIGNGSSILIHRSVFEKVGLFDESLKSGEDYEFWLRACLLHKYRFHCLQAFVLNYRKHQKQLSSQIKEDAEANRRYICNRVLRQIRATDPVLYKFLDYQLHPHTLRGAIRFVRRTFLILLPRPLKRIALNYWFRIRWDMERNS
jgi:glycosyltransferase involved in cell wall biosynthesis